MDGLIDVLAAQEEACAFERFDAETAWRIGSAIRRAVAAENTGALIDITFNGITLFRCAVASPTPHNQTWIGRKRNTVLEFWKSSLRVAAELKQNGKTLASRGLGEMQYALCGGGFPIRVRELGVLGAIVCSGLADTHDHQRIVDAVAEELGVSVPSVLGDS